MSRLPLSILLFTSLPVLFALSISPVELQTEVYCSRTFADLGSYVELRTTITEMGNRQVETTTQDYNLLRRRKTYAGKGVLIATAKFSGTLPPTNIVVKVVERDGLNKDDGVCVLDIAAAFTFDPITVTCTRERANGLKTEWKITVVVRQVA